MAYAEYVAKAISTGRQYEELPAKVRAAVALPEWKARVRDQCIQAGRAYEASAARGVAQELDYYEELLRQYKAWGRLYPYHLCEYVARVLRITPFRYYTDLLAGWLREEKSYDALPNLTAADALRLTGVGRNEYIATLNACRSKRVMWRLNRGLARDLLPAAPRDVRMQPWWRVAVVNVGESEFRELPGPEASLLRTAAEAARPLPVSAFDPDLLQAVYKRSLVYLTVPVGPGDHFHIPPLEGFVSNKTSEAGDASVDPLEPLMYRLFLANSSRLNQAQLSEILGVDLEALLAATALAVRLGFATRVTPSSGGGGGGGGTAAADAEAGSSCGLEASGHGGSSAQLGVGGASMGSLLALEAVGAAGGGNVVADAAEPIPDAQLDEGAAAAAATPMGPGGAAAAAAWRQEAAAGGQAGSISSSQGAVAVVVDAETTSFLMMGALSAGLKRHSVSLFEGGRISGAAVVDELIDELGASAAAGAMFEGMAQLMCVIESLGLLLQAVRGAAAAQGLQLELLRQEGLQGLDPIAAAKVLSATYTAVVPICPLPGHTLPRLLCQQQQQQQQAWRPPTPLSSSRASLGAAPAGGAIQQQQLAPKHALPAFFGPPSPEADSPWLQLALYAAAGAGPVSLVFVAGCRVWRLPPQLQGCTHALLWGWGAAAAAAASSAAASSGGNASAEARPLLVEGSSLLCTLNELLSRTAVMVQPLVHLEQLPPGLTAASEQQQQQQQQHLVQFVDVPLPLCPVLGSDQQQLQQQPANDPFAPPAAADQPPPPPPPSAPGTLADSSGVDGPVLVRAVGRGGDAAGQVQQLQLPQQVTAALERLHLSGAVGWLRLVRLPPPAGASAAAAKQQPWVPLAVNLGCPLFCPTLCGLVCANMQQQGSLAPAGQAAWTAAQQLLQQQVLSHMAALGGSSPCAPNTPPAHVSAAAGGGGGIQGSGVELPPQELLFDGHSLQPVDLSSCMQGVTLW